MITADMQRMLITILDLLAFLVRINRSFALVKIITRGYVMSREKFEKSDHKKTCLVLRPFFPFSGSLFRSHHVGDLLPRCFGLGESSLKII